MSALIDTLFDSPDDVEIIRDRIASILKVESDNQYKMAKAKKIDDAEDFNVKVFLENDRPFSIVDGDESFPSTINVSLTDVRPLVKVGGVAAKTKCQAKFLIDCYACGNFSDSDNDSQVASFKAWKLARVVRNILMSGQYAYLGWQGVVLNKSIESIKSGAVQKSEDSAFSVMIARIELAVDFYETSVSESGESLEGFNFEIDDKTGEVLVEI